MEWSRDGEGRELGFFLLDDFDGDYSIRQRISY